MLDIDQLNDVYDPGGPGPKSKVPMPKALGLPADRTRYARPAENMAPLSNVDLADKDLNTFLGGRGIPNPQTTGTDLKLMMGEAQTFGSKLGRKAANLVPNIAAGIIDMVGNVGQLAGEWGENRDYTNSMNDLAAMIKNPFGENYKRSNDTWAIGDPTWWIDHIGDVTEMAASFAIGGLGVGKLLGGAAKLATEGFNLGTRASMLVKGAAQLGTSAFVSFAESAQAGSQVYKDTYETQFNKLLAKGLNPGEADAQAKQIASQSAASTAQIGTLLTMGLNVGAYAPWFRKLDDVGLDVLGKRIAGMEANATRQEIAAAVRGLNVDDYADKFFHHSSWKAKVREMGAEGSEEVLQQFAEATGREEGKDGRTHGFFEQFGQLEKIIDRTANSQGLLSFTLGAAFGGIQNVLIHNVIPTKVDKIVNGNSVEERDAEEEIKMVKRGGVMVPAMQKTWATPRSQEHDFTTRKFDTLKESVAHDFENFDKIENEMIAHQKAGNSVEAEASRRELFNIGSMHAVKSGLTEPWKKTFDKIVNMQPAEAVEAGYATDENDTSYKSKATEAIAEMDTLTNMYTTLENKYGTKYQGNETAQELVNMVFARQTDIFTTDKIIKEKEQELMELRKRAETLPGVADISGLSNSLKAMYTTRENHGAVATALKRDLDTLEASIQDGGNIEVVKSLLKKYRAIGMGDGDINGSVKNLIEKITKIYNQTEKKKDDAETMLFNTPEYVEWLENNPDGKFDKFIDEVKERRQADADIDGLGEAIEIAKTRQLLAKENLSDITSEKNTDRFVRKAEKWRDDMIAEKEKVNKEQLATLAALVKEKETLKRAEKLNLNRIAETYREQRDAIAQRIIVNKKLLEAAKEKMRKAKWSDPVKMYSIRNEVKTLEQESKMLQTEFRRLNSLFNDYKVNVSPVEVTTEEATGEENGISAAEEEETAVTSTGEEETEIVPEEPENISQPIEPSIEVPEETTSFEPALSPLEVFSDLLSPAHHMVKLVLANGVEYAKQEGISISLDLLNRQIADGVITQPEATKLLQAANNYLDALRNDSRASEPDPEPEEPATEEPPAPAVPIILFSSLPEADSPEIDNNDPELAIEPRDLAYHAGDKIIDVLTGASSTVGYHEGLAADTSRGPKFIKVQNPSELNDTVNEDLLRMHGIPAGTEVEYVVDTEYDGPKHITDSLTWDENQDVIKATEKGSDYMENGKVKMNEQEFGNVPIKVVDKRTGKTITHIRKLDWLEMAFPRTSDRRNVVELLVDPDGTVTDNFAIQRERLLKHREAIVKRFNATGKPSTGKTGRIGTGHMLLNHVIEEKADGTIKSKIVRASAATLVPDEKIELVIAKGGVLESQRNYPSTLEKAFDQKIIPNGHVGMMIPTPNGSHLYAEIIGVPLASEGNSSGAVNSVIRAIELYMFNNTNNSMAVEIAELRNKTGFDVSTLKGLNGFVNQYYTYTKNFQDSVTLPNTEIEKGERFMFAIDDRLEGVSDKTKQIKVAFSRRGEKVVYANVENGKLKQNFIDALTEGFSERSKAVVHTNPGRNLIGINSKGSFTDAVFVEGKWVHKSYPSYNNYIKSFSTTSVYGKNKLSTGEYVYVANPILPLTFDGVETQPDLVPNQAAETVTLPEPETASQDMLDALDNIMNSRPAMTVKVKEIGNGAENSKELTEQSLREIYNFTPQDNRNGKTVSEVLTELTNRGHTFIPEGFNPFSTCK